jgi:hypothetical protein
MIEPSVRFPVVCPNFLREVRSDLPLAQAAGALIRQRGIRMHSPCHDVYWDAGAFEMEQLREYVQVWQVASSRNRPTL